MKAILAAFFLLTSSLTVQAETVCSHLQKQERNLAQDLEKILDSMDGARSEADSDVYLRRYEIVYQTYQSVKSEIANHCEF